MNGFFEQLETQLHGAAHAQTAGWWARLRTRWGGLRAGARTVPILAALAVTVCVVVVAVTVGSHTHRIGKQPEGVGSNTSTATSTTPGAPPAGGDNLTGTWSGHYSGAYNGTLTITWQQSGWKKTGPYGDYRSNVDGSIKLSAPPGTLSVHGTVGSGCPNKPPPCNSPAPIRFRTVGAVGIIFTGTVGLDLSDTYRTAKGTGSWSANQVGAP